MLQSRGRKFAIVAGRFNAFIVDKLVAGAMDAIVRTGGDRGQVTVMWCPGAFEVPQLARRAVDAGGYDAVICLGCVIRGATPHFDYVAGESAKGVGELARIAKIPVTFGILTTDTI